jgi:hypothetical protein
VVGVHFNLGRSFPSLNQPCGFVAALMHWSSPFEE